MMMPFGAPTALLCRITRMLRTGFTLFELVIVLAIITAMVAVVVPHATRSNESLKIKQECLSMAEAIRYITDLAVESKRPTRILIDPQNNTYILQSATEISRSDYKPLEGFGGDRRSLGESVRITDFNGFDMEGNSRYLLFDPAAPWPNASISISTGNQINTIKITGRQVEIEESEI